MRMKKPPEKKVGRPTGGRRRAAQLPPARCRGGGNAETDVYKRQVLGPARVNFAGVAFWLALLAASTLAAGAAQWVLGVCTRRVSALAASEMRLAAFRNLSRLPLSYIDSHPHGDIISRMTNDAELVAEGLLQGLTQLLPGAATILGTLCVMAVLNPFIAFVVVAVTPLSIWFAGFVAKRTAGFFAANSAAQGRLSGFVNEMVAGQEVVRALDVYKRQGIYSRGFRIPAGTQIEIIRPKN